MTPGGGDDGGGRGTAWACLFGLLWLWIGLASAWDMLLAVRYAAVLDEENPWGRQLIAWGGVPLLAGVKMAGTVCVLGVLAVLWNCWRRAAWACAAALAAVQAALACYLHLA